MSCFMTSRQSKSNLANRLVSAAVGGGDLTEYAAAHGLSDARGWFVKLTEMNRNSLENRYGDRFGEMDDMPEPRQISDMRFLTSLRCLLYQCDYASDDTYGSLKKALTNLAYDIEAHMGPDVIRSDEFDAEEWD